MKKIIAISVMFALVAGAAFADTSLGGGMNVHFDLAIDKTQGNGEDVGAGDYGGGGDFNANWEGDNAGGQLRVYGDSFPGHAIGWWKPIDQLKIALGGWDGDWGHSQIVGWGFTAGAKDFVATKWGGYGTAFAGDSTPAFWGGFNNGLFISVYPADGFEINIGVPLVGAGAPPAAVLYANSKINVKADIPDVGTVKLALDLKKDNKDADQISDIFFAFYLGAIENMGVELGLGVTTSGATDKKNDKIDLGIGYSLNADDFGFKLGLNVGIAGNKGEGDKETLPLSVQLLPSYNLGSLTAFFNFGVSTILSAPEGASSGDFMNIWVNPYVQVPISGGSFWAGIKVYQGSKWDNLVENKIADKPDVKWSIPIGYSFGF